MTNKVFISYSHKDEAFKDSLEEHLAPLKRSGTIDSWNDRKIIAGQPWEKVISTNLTGPFICTQACIGHMISAGAGAIVNIASISGVRASTLRMAYGTSKAALMHLTKQQAVEYGNLGIRVNAIAPGPVETDMAKLVHSSDIRTAYNDAIPLARYGTINEIANAVYFLCSDEASYINGQILCVDGGFDAAGVGLPSLRSK